MIITGKWFENAPIKMDITEITPMIILIIKYPLFFKTMTPFLYLIKVTEYKMYCANLYQLYQLQ